MKILEKILDLDPEPTGQVMTDPDLNPTGQDIRDPYPQHWMEER